MDKLVTNQTDVAFSYYNAMEKEVQKSATAEAHLFPLAFVMMIIYASIATSGRRIDCVYDLQNLGRTTHLCLFLAHKSSYERAILYLSFKIIARLIC
jgi:hypothetical protein